MKKLLLVFALLGSILYTSCSSDEENNGNSDTLTLTPDSYARYVNENITFTAVDEDGENVTSETTFYVNNIAITGNVYTSSVVGSYAIKAVRNGITSPTVNVLFNAAPIPLTSITTTTTTLSVDKGDVVNLRAVGNNGADLTSSSTFYMNDVAIIGSSITTTTAGTINVYSTHTPSGGSMITSPTIQITINDVIKFNKRVLIEDFTGTWCGYCPRVAYAIDLVNQETNDAVVVAIHRGNDPYNFSAAGALESQIGLTGYPTAMLNRTTEWNYPETATTSINQAVNLTSGVNPKVGVAMTTTTSGSSASVQVNVKFGSNFSNLKLVVYALENNLIYDQTNYTSYYGGSSVISDFEHDHVLRAVLSTSILGETITGSTNLNDEFSKTFNYNIPGNVNAANVRFVAVVLDSSKKALNSREAGANETQTFEVE
ncbi:Omp28-related outer membrane protein [Flavobacterium sp. LMO8]|uniref:Omp28-related outer membrane protein n=1 Tax=Flavobacterium sp. LMO8 TaxID=2654244 RepID=UPI001290E44C|nr:Omp28-related outer membrane protein [Flavobacterium sp. LMO8]MQP25511.1 Omp28-related outer membrane protein [Flavobacterium sp. LMO8]